MNTEILLALLLKKVEGRLAELPDTSRLRGPRGQRGSPGQDGKSFVFSEHEETIKTWAKEFSLKFEDLTTEQIGQLRGATGKDGRDGKDFNIDDHEEALRAWAQEYALKFDDLTAEQIGKLRGPQGKDGKDGKDFCFEDHASEIETAIRGAVEAVRETLRLTFADLTAEEIEQIRGPRGKDGRDGRDGADFNFEEHREFFSSFKPKFSDFTDEERDSLRLHFSQLTEEEKSSLKLKFDDLTDDDRLTLKGARGPRGQKGSQGRDGESIVGPMGPRGLPGPIGMRGAAGPVGKDGEDGRDGKDGKDAAYITDITVDQTKDEVEFIFDFSDGTRLTTNSIKLPRSNVYFSAGGSSGGGGGEGGGGEPGPPGPEGPQGPAGADGKSAYAIAVEEGFVGTEEEWLESLKASIEFFNDGVSIGKGSEVDFVGEAVIASRSGERVTVEISGSGGGGTSILENVLCDTSVFVGAAVRLDQDAPAPLMMSEWPNLRLLPKMSASSYSTIAVNALADSISNSNVIGIVESKSTADRCNIRILGPSSSLYVGLDVNEEYYLSDTNPGAIVARDEAPTGPGTVLVKIGQPISSSRMLYSRGDRVVNS